MNAERLTEKIPHCFNRMTMASQSRWKSGSVNQITRPDRWLPAPKGKNVELPTKANLTEAPDETEPGALAASETNKGMPFSQAGGEMNAEGPAPVVHRAAPTRTQMTGATSDLVEEVLGEVLTRLVETLPESAILTILLEVVLLLPLVKRPTPWLKNRRPTLH